VIVLILYFFGIQQLSIKEVNLHFDGNLLIALATVILALVGYQQLNKLRSSNSLQFLFHIEKEWNSKEMVERRKSFAERIPQYLKEKNINSVPPGEWRKILNIAGSVADFFEKIAHIRNCTNGTDFYDKFEWLYKKLVEKYKLNTLSLEKLQEFCEEEKEIS
jgi:hypothetical protein